MTDHKRRQYTKEFKKEATELVIRQNYTVTQAAGSLGINNNMLGRWCREYRAKQQDAFPGTGRQSGEADELNRLREENRQLKLEREILKKRRHSSPGSPGKVRIYLSLPVCISGTNKLPGT